MLLMSVVLLTSFFFDSINAFAGSGEKSAGFTSKSKPVLSRTVEQVAAFDYVTDSVTGLTQKNYKTSKIQKLLADYGSFTGKGMPYEEYVQAMNYKWVDSTEYGKKVKPVAVDISKAYSYEELVKLMKLLSRIEGVYLFDIGRTTQGRTMYALEVDIPSAKKKQTVVLTGSVHARECAGSIYILKELSELLQAGTAEAGKVLKRTRFAAVICVNPDGRESVAFDTRKYTYAGKPWSTADQQSRCRSLTEELLSVLNRGNSYKYRWISEEEDYDLNGTGSTITDFACSLAYGAKYSPGYGFFVYTDGTEEYPLIMIPRLDSTRKKLLPELNRNFATMTFEIGYDRSYLGYGKDARICNAQEYKKYHFERVLYKLSELAG